jgi:hypothetical protein
MDKNPEKEGDRTMRNTALTLMGRPIYSNSNSCDRLCHLPLLFLDLICAIHFENDEINET